jgi:hypothetical protein
MLSAVNQSLSCALADDVFGYIVIFSSCFHVGFPLVLLFFGYIFVLGKKCKFVDVVMLFVDFDLLFVVMFAALLYVSLCLLPCYLLIEMI